VRDAPVSDGLPGRQPHLRRVPHFRGNARGAGHPGHVPSGRRRGGRGEPRRRGRHERLQAAVPRRGHQPAQHRRPAQPARQPHRVLQRVDGRGGVRDPFGQPGPGDRPLGICRIPGQLRHHDAELPDPAAGSRTARPCPGPAGHHHDRPALGQARRRPDRHGRNSGCGLCGSGRHSRVRAGRRRRRQGRHRLRSHLRRRCGHRGGPGPRLRHDAGRTGTRGADGLDRGRHQRPGVLQRRRDGPGRARRRWTTWNSPNGV
jgi:hypothetical protein